MQTRASGLTDVGLRREGNEDAFSVEDCPGLYIVADGMGGHLAGEVASQIAVEMINKSYRKWSEQGTAEDELFGFHDPSLSRTGNYILSSIRLANRVVREMAVAYEQYHGMGTTVVILLVTPTQVIAANVGDSRIYLIRDGRIERLSRDHTIVSEQVELGVMTEEEAATSPLKHILTRNLGSSEDVEPDIFEIEPSNDDRFILCSDGLTDLVGDQEILGMARMEDDPETLCREFVAKALGNDEVRDGQFIAQVGPINAPDSAEGEVAMEEPAGGIAVLLEKYLQRGVEIVVALVFVFLLLKSLKGARASAKASAAASTAAATEAEIDPELLARVQVEELLRADPDRVGEILSSWAREEAGTAGVKS